MDVAGDEDNDSMKDCLPIIYRVQKWIADMLIYVNERKGKKENEDDGKCGGKEKKGGVVRRRKGKL